jgi:hypothetical protein
VDLPPLAPGTMMSTVILSPVIDGLLRTWENDRPETWRVEDPSGLTAELGRGGVARAPVESDRFREVGMLSVSGDRGVLMIPARYQKDDSVSGTGFELSRVKTTPVTDNPWNDLQPWLRLVTFSAAERGDVVLLERGGWDAPRQPYALFVVRQSDRGWVTHLEAAPAPALGQPPWPSPPPQLEGAKLSAPATRTSVAAAAVAMVMAAQEWAASPLDVGVTFAKAPDGPMMFEPEATAAPPSTAPPTPHTAATSPPRDAAPSAAELTRHLVELDVASTIRQFVEEVARRRKVTSQLKASYVNIRRNGASSVAMYVHRAKVSLSLDPARAQAMAARLPGSVLQEKSAATSYLVVDEEVLRAAPQELVVLAVEAVDR